MKNQKTIASSLCGLLAAATLGLAASPAEAARYRGVFDPVFGSPFTNPLLGWRGEAEFDVNDNCANGPGLVEATGNCTAVVESAFVDFYIDQAGVDTEPTLARINFAVLDTSLPAGGPTTDDYAINRLFFNANRKLVGVDAGLTAFLDPFDFNPNDNITLQFLFGNNLPKFALEFNLGSLVSPTDGPYNGPLVYWQQGRGCTTCNNTNDPRNVPTFSIDGISAPAAVVPEPGSLTLVGLALAAAGFVAARRRRG